MVCWQAYPDIVPAKCFFFVNGKQLASLRCRDPLGNHADVMLCQCFVSVGVGSMVVKFSYLTTPGKGMMIDTC